MQNNDQYNSFSLVKFVWKWRRWLLIIGLATAILSLLCTYLVAPRYKSTAVIYAPRTNSMSKILLNKENYNERLEVKAYALQEETEQMMQILNALEIKDSLISRFKLAEHYDINPDSKGAETKLYKTLTNNLTFKRTEFGAISITVSDEDPQIACDMADYILSLVDTVKNRTERERAAAAYYALKRQVDSVNKEIARIDDSIQVCMENGVFELKEQTNRVMQQWAIAVAQGNQAAISRLENEQKKLAEWGPRLEMPVKFVVDRPIPADKKYFPKRSVIMIVSTFCVLAISLIVLLMIEKIEEKPSVKPEESVD